jgi:hypothetical protein
VSFRGRGAAPDIDAYRCAVGEATVLLQIKVNHEHRLTIVIPAARPLCHK